jgi:uncharacterized protein YmfQ (DUF2313 family)
MVWRPRDADAFAYAMLAKLPLGEIWQRVFESTLVKVIRALAGVAGRWAARVGRFLITEAFPLHAIDLLPDWERVLGLPEPCFPPALTLEERRLHVLEKLRRRPGAQSRAYFTDLGRRLGYHEDGPSPHAVPQALPFGVGRIHAVRITEYRPFMAGVSRAGDPRWQIAPPEMRFVWKVGVPGQRLTWFRAGASRAGQDPHLRIRRAEDLECIFHKYKPAHTRLIFAYEGI